MDDKMTHIMLLVVARRVYLLRIDILQKIKEAS